jgi:prevent-host-death family protein
MKLMTATEVSRNFAAVLDAVEHGETITITRGNHRIARLGPEPRMSAREVLEKLANRGERVDEDYRSDIRATVDGLDHEIRDPWEEN